VTWDQTCARPLRLRSIVIQRFLAARYRVVWPLEDNLNPSSVIPFQTLEISPPATQQLQLSAAEAVVYMRALPLVL